MFDEKEKVKFVAEGIRNAGVALLVGGMIAFATTNENLFSIVIVPCGLVSFIASAMQLEVKELKC